jgi:ATP-dependent Lon protease
MPGRIIEILRETKCMNPIILVDELDKISQTHQGKEIVGTLIHLTDTTTNGKYTYDKYFSGVEFDLSKVMFIFTYNDPDKVDKILADRLFKIRVENYTTKEKLEITQQHIIKNVLQEFNFSNSDISFSKDSIEYIVKGSSSDEGMRDIKRKIEIVVSRINTLLLTKREDCVVDLKYKELYDYYSQLPIVVQKEHIDTFLHQSISNNEPTPPPFGMYT